MFLQKQIKLQDSEVLLLFLGTMIANYGKATLELSAFSFSKLMTVLLPDFKKGKESTNQKIIKR